MIEIEDKIVSDDILLEKFLCDLKRCKGECCVEGDAGAPLEEQEVEILEREYPNYSPYMTGEGRRAVQQQGYAVTDEEGELTTPLVGGAECAYSVTENGICRREGLPRRALRFHQTYIVPSLSDTRGAFLERGIRPELPSLAYLLSGRQVRPTCGCARVQGSAGADHKAFRRGVL